MVKKLVIHDGISSFAKIVGIYIFCISTNMLQMEGIFHLVLRLGESKLQNRPFLISLFSSSQVRSNNGEGRKRAPFVNMTASHSSQCAAPSILFPLPLSGRVHSMAPPR